MNKIKKLFFIVFLNVHIFNTFAAHMLEDDVESFYSLPKSDEDDNPTGISASSNEILEIVSNDIKSDTKSSSDDSDLEIVINHKKRRKQTLVEQTVNVEAHARTAEDFGGAAGGGAMEDEDEYTYDYCPFCPQKPKFDKLIKLFTHLKDIHDGKCPITNCENKRHKGTSYSKFSKHKQLHLKAYKCEICNILFKSRNAFVDHNRIHNGTDKCKICNAVIKSNSTEIDHYQVMHGDGYKCPECLTQFNYRASLKKHLMEIHVYSKEKAATYINNSIQKTIDLIKTV